jgi:hypothetical protein
MKMKWFLNSLTALLLLLAAEGRARADLIVNGGFESGDFTGWTTGAISYPEYIVTSPVHSGQYAAQIAGYSYGPDTLSQTITTTTVGQHYDLSFWRYVGGGGPTELLNVYWDGQQVYSELNPGARPYEQISVDVVGTGSDTVLFQCANDPDFTYLDDISLNPSVTAAPEPGSLTLLGIAGICLAGGAIRSRRLLKAAL